MQNDTTISIAVISDLHAYDSLNYQSDNAPSHFDVSAQNGGLHCPVESLLTLINQSVPRLNADMLLCPGDFCNRACPTSLPIAWSRIQEIVAALKAGLVVATTGNHDVDSRFGSTEYDPLEALKDLSPRFPIGDASLCNQYWAEHFFLLDTEQIRLVVLNSSAYHAGRIEEVDHGRIASRTLKQLTDALNESPDKAVNLLLCHHNPQVHSELGLGEDDFIRGGQILLDLIGAPERGNWLVIHGHKHHPKLTYASGGASSPIVFSAGSLASTLYPTLATETGNQFYILEIDVPQFEKYGLVGTFRTWDWHHGFGWRTAESSKGLPASGGFGYRANPTELASKVHQELSSERSHSLLGQDIYQRLPQLRYLTPMDLDSLANALVRFSCIMTIRADGHIDEAMIV